MIGAHIDELSFDVERNNKRYSVVFQDVSVLSSMASIRLRRIDTMGVGHASIRIEPLEMLTAIPSSTADLQVSDVPIPSDLFVMLPVAEVDIRHYEIDVAQHQLKIESTSNLTIDRNALETSIRMTAPSVPIIEIGIRLTESNQLHLTGKVLLSGDSDDQQPLRIVVDCQVAGHYQALDITLNGDINIAQLRSLLLLPAVEQYMAKLPGYDKWQGVLDDGKGQAVFSLETSLPLSTVPIPRAKNRELLETIWATGSLKGRTDIHFSNASKGVELKAHADLTTVNGLVIGIEQLSLDSGYIQQQADTLVSNPVIFDQGSLLMSATFTLASDSLINWSSLKNPIAAVNGVGRVQLNSADIALEEVAIMGVEGDMSISKQGTLVSFSTKPVSIETVDFGMQASKVVSGIAGEMDITSGQYSIRVADTSLELLGGQISIAPFPVTGPTLKTSMKVTLEAIDLAKVLELQGSSELHGEGVLGGVLPISINAGAVEILGGELSSGDINGSLPAGRIQYQRNAGADAVAQSDPSQQVDFLLQAMEDFQYTSLLTEVTLYAPDNLLLGVSLRGSNSKVENGRAIHLNLNLEQNINPLIRTLILQSQLNNNLLNQYQEQHK
ncbi:hypothetical protein A9Q99_10695 [Gammaproteobacteria bacterium 45_16_T64]|nr:hypothetical protein A9Q99_10695 [Gammaproteobacteria bacterium 45_16_T64]